MFRRLSLVIATLTILAVTVWADLAPLPRKPKPPTQPATAVSQPVAPVGG